MSSPAILIRSMRLADIDQVVAIDRLSFSLPWPANSYRFELFENQASRLWVAERLEGGVPGPVVAMIVIWNIVDEAHIATLAVHPDYRRLGIGKHLLAYALKDALEQGMLTATLEVRAGNQAAQSMYRQFGFTVAGVRLRYYQDNQEDALVMSVKLKDIADRIQSIEDTRAYPPQGKFEI